MKTSPFKYLAAVITCGAMLAGGEISAQTEVTGYSARPLPPMAEAATTQRRFNAPTTQSRSGNFAETRLNHGTLFTIEEPPVPKDFDVSARIIRNATVESKMQSAPAKIPAQIQSRSFSVNTAQKSPADKAIPQAAIFQRVAERPSHLITQNEQEPGRYLVSFVKRSQEADLDPVLDSPNPATDSDSGPEITVPAEVEQTEDFEALDADEELEPAMDDGRTDNLADIGSDDNRETDDGDGDDLVGLDDDIDQDDDFQRAERQFGVWPKKSIREVSTDVRDFGGVVPDDESSVLTGSTQRYYRATPRTEKVFAWAAPKIRYQPLYFEDAQLERYGQTRGLNKQPLVSGFKFFRDAALLPLNAAIDHPHSCDGPLGFCRPGSPSTGCGCSNCQR